MRYGYCPIYSFFSGVGGAAFSKNGNFKVIGIYDRCGLMQDGFTFETAFKTGSNVSAEETVAGNLHAGGYGFDIEAGVICRCDVSRGSSPSR